MGGSGGSADAPDVAGAARAEGQASKEITEQQTWANRPNQVNPWGTVTWDKGREWDATTKQWINTWQQNEKLNPQLYLSHLLQVKTKFRLILCLISFSASLRLF